MLSLQRGVKREYKSDQQSAERHLWVLLCFYCCSDESDAEMLVLNCSSKSGNCGSWSAATSLCVCVCLVACILIALYAC